MTTAHTCSLPHSWLSHVCGSFPPFTSQPVLFQQTSQHHPVKRYSIAATLRQHSFQPSCPSDLGALLMESRRASKDPDIPTIASDVANHPGEDVHIGVDSSAGCQHPHGSRANHVPICGFQQDGSMIACTLASIPDQQSH